jgi:hypothetical protein
MKMQDTVSGESYLLCFNDEQISMLDLETGEWTEDQMLLADLPTDDPERRMQIIQTYMSRDGRYVVAVENEGFMDDEGPASLQLYDRQKGCWVEMPEEIRSLRLEASYTELVFMAEHKNLAAVFEEGKRQLVLWDLDRMEIIQESPFDGTEQRLVRFVADDSALLFWGNDNYLKLWDIETACIKMEDSQKLYSVKDMWVYDDSGLLEIQGFDETTKDYRNRLNLWQIWLYQLKEDGTLVEEVPAPVAPKMRRKFR